MRRSRPAHVSYPQTRALRPLRPADTSHGSSTGPEHRIHSTRRRLSRWQTTEAGVTLSTGVHPNTGGPWRRTAPGPEGLLHHLPALVLRRPSVSAFPTEMPAGMLGSRLLDRRPPHYRCPAVPGARKAARAILMASNSSVLPSLFVLFGSQPRQPSCHCSGLEPHCRTSRCARPQPTPSPRYHSLIPLRVQRVLLAAAPEICGPPGPVVSSVAVLQPPWLRNSTTAPSCALQLRYCCPAVHVCRALPPVWATRETITTSLTNVYSDKDRFSCVGGAARSRAAREGRARQDSPSRAPSTTARP